MPEKVFVVVPMWDPEHPDGRRKRIIAQFDNRIWARIFVDAYRDRYPNAVVPEIFDEEEMIPT